MTDRNAVSDTLDGLALVAARNWRTRPGQRMSYEDSNAAHTKAGEALWEAASAVLLAFRNAEVRGGLWAPRTAREAALACYARLLGSMAEAGEHPRAMSWETFLLRPDQSEDHYAGAHWHLCYEAGPEWWPHSGTLVPLAWESGDAHRTVDGGDGRGWFCETFWGFDLIFMRD